MSVSERFQGANVVDAGRLSPYWGEHAARYRYALSQVEGKKVLDIACGTGYGIGLMQDDAGFVCGVDVDIEAASLARLECSANSTVLLGDGLRLPFRDGCFEIITSFETIEHLSNRFEFLSELDRVLSPSGKIFLSTPNALYTKPINGKPSNRFHVFEYTPKEFRTELEHIFRVDEHVGQKLNIGNRISPFFTDQQKLQRKLYVQVRLFGWRIMNKLPLTLREALSDLMWKRPFYPTEVDYIFSEEELSEAPVQLAVCRKK